MQSPAASAIATMRSGRSFFFSSSTMSILISSAQDFAVGTETGFFSWLITKGVIQPIEQWKNNRSRNRAASGQPRPLPERGPAKQWGLADSEKTQNGPHRHRGA